MKKNLLCMILLLALASPAFSQTWFKVATEPDTVTTTAGQTWRYGAPSGTTGAGVVCPCWSASSTKAIAGASISDSGGGFLAPDPAQGVVKELDILETAVAQTVTVNGVAVKVPALPPTTYPPIAFAPKTAYSFTVSNLTGTAPLTVALTIQYGSISVPLVCTSNSTIVNPTTGTVPFSCIPAAIPVASN